MYLKSKQVIPALTITLFVTIVILLNLKFPYVEKQTHVEYQHNEEFGMVVDEYKWEGKLQPGRYTNNGVLIIKQ